MTIEQIKEIGYRKLTADNMGEYLKENGSKAQIKEFVANAYAFVERVPVLDDEGMPVYTKAGRISKKNGKAITPRAKTQIKVITDGKRIAELKKKGVKPEYRAFDAKQWFCATFAPEMLPKAQEDTDKRTALDLLNELQAML